MSEYPRDNRPKKSYPETTIYMHPNTPGAPKPHISEANPAKWNYQQLVECIYEFEKRLDDEHEVGVRLNPSGPNVAFHLKDAGYQAPHLITLSGENEEGETLQLVQHVSQLSVFLVGMKSRTKETFRIGFKLKRAVAEDDI